jgi:hypothetical protein
LSSRPVSSFRKGLRSRTEPVAQATARELGPKNIHVAHLIIDSGVDTEWVRQRRIEALGPNALDDSDLLMPPSSVAESYWLLYQQPKKRRDFRARDPSVQRELVAGASHDGAPTFQRGGSLS